MRLWLVLLLGVLLVSTSVKAKDMDGDGIEDDTGAGSGSGNNADEADNNAEDEDNKDNDNDGDDDDDDDDDDDNNESSSNMTELRFVPEDKGVLDVMFHAMSECQALHPDTNDFSEDEEAIFEDAEDDDEGEYETGDGDADAVFVGLVGNPFQAVQNGNNPAEPMDMDEGQFEDAED